MVTFSDGLWRGRLFTVSFRGKVDFHVINKSVELILATLRYMIWTIISLKKKNICFQYEIPVSNFWTKFQTMTLCAGRACPCVVRTIKIPLLWRAIKNLSWTPRDTTSLNYPMHYLCTVHAVVEIGFEGVQKNSEKNTF